MHPSVESGAYDLVLFDADGTLRRCTVANQPCPNRDDEWELITGVKEQLRAFSWQERGIMTGVVSNQAGVALGYMTEPVAIQLVVDMFVDVFGFPPKQKLIRVCPHAPEMQCSCRKPKPEMLRQCMWWANNTTPARTLYVGDLESDKQAAANAGVDFLWAWEFFGKSQDEWIGWLSMRAEQDRADELTRRMMALGA